MPRAGVWLLVVLIGFFPGCKRSGQEGDKMPAGSAPGVVPAEYAKGEAVFGRFCLGCHGQGAMGTGRGPSFIQRVYEPSHHGDEAFYRAARMGVQAHHWSFGNMPPIAGVTDDELKEIVAYVRWLQRQAGIQ
ncbi:MAG TPA: cytochrome c [Nitrospiria bacterium]